MTIELNIDRLKYLMALYNMSEAELLDIVNTTSVNKPSKKPYSIDEIFSDNVNVKVINKIDKVFGKGLIFYIDPTPISKAPETSIFFRKQKFDTPLNLESRKMVAEYESLKLLISATCKLADVDLKRKLPCFTVDHNPYQVADEIRGEVYPDKVVKDKKKFMTKIIDNLSKYNVFVFEYLENHNLKAKINIDGLFLSPNFIVVKKTTKSRELLTLAHELGHLLLNQEEVEPFDCLALNFENLSRIERWCYDFAFYFLLGDNYSEISKIKRANASNDYCHSLIERIANETHMSRLAIYTHLLYNNQISQYDYSNVKGELEEEFEKKKEFLKLNSYGGMVPKPIESKLLTNSLRAALYSGVISEYDFGNLVQRIYKTTDYQRFL